MSFGTGAKSGICVDAMPGQVDEILALWEILVRKREVKFKDLLLIASIPIPCDFYERQNDTA